MELKMNVLRFGGFSRFPFPMENRAA